MTKIISVQLVTNCLSMLYGSCLGTQISSDYLGDTSIFVSH